MNMFRIKFTQIHYKSSMPWGKSLKCILLYVTTEQQNIHLFLPPSKNVPLQSYILPTDTQTSRTVSLDVFILLSNCNQGCHFPSFPILGCSACFTLQRGMFGILNSFHKCSANTLRYSKYFCWEYLKNSLKSEQIRPPQCSIEISVNVFWITCFSLRVCGCSYS